MCERTRKMYGQEIDNILSTNPVTKNIYKGIYASNQIPRLRGLKYPAAYIFNTDEDFRPGQHWVAIFLKSRRAQPEYFDSYGVQPIKQSFKRFMKRLNKSYRYNKQSLQSLLSKVCGEYTVYYVFHKSKGYTLRKILSNFSNDCEQNDEIVKYFVKRLQPKPRYDRIITQYVKNISTSDKPQRKTRSQCKSELMCAKNMKKVLRRLLAAISKCK